MQQEETTNYIIRKLASHSNPKDVALAVCEKTNMSWAEAQQLVQQVQSQHGQEIVDRQKRAITILSSMSLLIGLAAMCIGTWALSQGMVNRISLMSLILGAGVFLGGVRGFWSWFDAFFE